MSNQDEIMQNVVIDSLKEYVVSLSAKNKKLQQDNEVLHNLIDQILQKNETPSEEQTPNEDKAMIKEMNTLIKALENDLARETNWFRDERVKNFRLENEKLELKKQNEDLKNLLEKEKRKNKDFANTTSFCRPEIAIFASDTKSSFHSSGRFPCNPFLSSNTKESSA
jgi:hypothetical protein